jgi:uncharacterized protein YkwD
MFFLFSRAGLTLLAVLAIGVGFCSQGRGQEHAPVPAVDTTNRFAVIDLYQKYYLTSNNIAPDWTGNVLTGIAGTLSQSYLKATLRRVNYYRAMSGLSSDIIFSASYDDMCQQAALMMAAQGDISHTPAPDWKFYTAAAAEAAANSDIRLDSVGDEGPGAVDRFMADAEANNTYVGHRRWLMYPAAGDMGAGAVQPSALSDGTAAIWVLTLVPRPADAPLSTSWPPAGYVPAGLVLDRWSFSYLNADFGATTVAVNKDGAPMAIQQEALVGESGNGSDSFVGDNTIVWEMPANVVSTTGDEIYQVHLANVRINGVAQNFDYTVTSIQPELSKITVAAPVPIAHRAGPVVGKFKLIRTGDLSPAQKVSYRVGGTGMPGTDYAALTGTVAFQPGAATAKIRVAPLADGKGKKTVTVTLEKSSEYKLGTAAEATVTIKN